jgi:tRNA threonylcarbamoyladenosine biosynthesis protein TsaE
MRWPVTVTTASPDGTRAVAAALAALCGPGDVLLLTGELGAGKTVFAQGFAAALGVPGPVTSPTFALVRQYRCQGHGPVETLIHADVYRTGSLPEVVELALAELVEEQAIALVEWGELAAPAFGDDALAITLDRPAPAGTEVSDEARTITVTGLGAWAGRRAEVAAALAPEPGAAQ